MALLRLQPGCFLQFLSYRGFYRDEVNDVGVPFSDAFASKCNLSPA